MAMKPIGVSQLNAYIKRVLQTDPLLGQVSVLGEISNLKYHDSGHVYFSLKDNGGKINCFLPQNVANGMPTLLEDGMEIIATGHVSVFERGGYYSLQIKAVELSGLGDLGIAFDQLKKKLLEEGLFDASHKKALPRFPAQIAIVTSGTGAALQDMLKIITEKNNVVDILVYPVLVQGPNAAADIAAGIQSVNRLFPQTDVMIVGRGGGSLEELWAFNEEAVARSIFQSQIPIISAVGHETDVTIADFVADARGETPTAAAAMAVPNTNELREYIDFMDGKILENFHYYLDKKRQELANLNFETFHKEILNRIEVLGFQLTKQRDQINLQMEKKIEGYTNFIWEKYLLLEHLNPKAIMKMGYSAILSKQGKLITGIEELHVNTEISLILADGTANASIRQIGRKENE